MTSKISSPSTSITKKDDFSAEYGSSVCPLSRINSKKQVLSNGGGRILNKRKDPSLFEKYIPGVTVLTSKKKMRDRHKNLSCLSRIPSLEASNWECGRESRWTEQKQPIATSEYFTLLRRMEPQICDGDRQGPRTCNMCRQEGCGLHGDDWMNCLVKAHDTL